MQEDSARNFYGAATGAGANGVVFEYSSTGVYSVIYNFKGGTADGWRFEMLNRCRSIGGKAPLVHHTC